MNVRTTAAAGLTPVNNDARSGGSGDRAGEGRCECRQHLKTTATEVAAKI